MYLKSIKISGFKSFADKIELDIKKGITGIVGPNGSGKSNIVDAVRWVLGEQSVKNLRGNGSMSDVIFAGSKVRNALTRASVALTFDNTDHYLNSEFNEVEIKRVVYKTGENEYYINNIKVRLKDITELFIDSGAGKEAFNIISQGSVENVVSSKPEDRRVIIEGAAGVLKYKKRKEEAVRKLEKTKDNLEKVNLVIKELETQVEPLRKQSIIAKEYLEYKTELENIEVSLIAADVNNINREYNKLKAHLEAVKQEVEGIDASTSKDNAKLEQLKLLRIKLDEEITTKNEELINLQKEISELQAKKQLVIERKKYEVDDAKLQDNIILLKEEELSLAKNIKTLEQEITNLNNEVAEKQETKDKIDEENLTITRNLYTYNNEYNVKTREILDLRNKIDILNSNILNDTKVPVAVKSILNNPRLKGIHKTIIKLIEVEDTYVNAIETSLGSNCNVIVVDNELCVKEAINYLKNQHLGRATFFPLNIIKGRSIEIDILNKLKNTKGFIDVAANLVKYDSKYENIINNQLGNVLIVDNIDTLNIVAKQINYKYKIVSLDGEVSFAGGAITGGTSKGQGNLLNQKYELNNLIKKEALLKEEIDMISKHQEKLKQQEEQKETTINKLQKELAELKESLNRKNISLSDLKRQHKERLEELEGTNNVKENTLDQELENILKVFYEKNTQKELTLNDLSKLKKQKDELNDKIEILENSVHKISSDYNKKLNDLKNTEVTLGKLDVKLDNYLITLNETYNMTYEKAISSVDINIDIDTSRLQVNKLKAKIKELGDVNLGSISEFERVNERYTFLKSQESDLTTSCDALLGVIKEMDEIMKERFASSFQLVNREFKEVFKTLFKGGEGHLELTNPEDLLTTGIDIIAQPPGKKLNSITLFSGGERTLTAIALLFAILNVKTVPFVILDEVEAALDEANVDVFGKYLQTKKDKSQFIIITHKKRTMEYADCLYGITMQEQGVSKLVSVRLED